MSELSEYDRQQCEGLLYLRWDMFDSPDQPGSGKKYMEHEPVLILDKIVHQSKMILDVELGYVSPTKAKMMGLTTHDSHRIGKAIRIRVLNPKKRMKLVSRLIKLGVRRIALGWETVYFDTDSQKPEWLSLWC